jgi:hypothetical protein
MNLRTKFDTSRLVGMVTMVLASSLLALLPKASADTVTVNSGSAVTFLTSGFVAGDFPSPFTMANFTAAQTGTAASVLSSTPFHISSLPDRPGALWIGTNPSAGAVVSDTALYAISFNLPTCRPLFHPPRSICATLLTNYWASLTPESTSTGRPSQALLVSSAHYASQVSPRKITTPMRASVLCLLVGQTSSTSMR